MENAKRTNDNFRLKWPTHRRREKKKNTNTKAKTLLLHALLFSRFFALKTKCNKDAFCCCSCIVLLTILCSVSALSFVYFLWQWQEERSDCMENNAHGRFESDDRHRQHKQLTSQQCHVNFTRTDLMVHYITRHHRLNM